MRLQVAGDGELIPVGRPAGGRSAYVHASARCLDGLTKRRGVRRALKRDLTADICARAAERVRVATDGIER